MRLPLVFSSLSLIVVTALSPPAHAQCLDKGLPGWVQQFGHVEGGCSRVGKLLAGLTLPPATNAVEASPEGWRGAALVIVDKKTVTINGRDVASLTKEGRIPARDITGHLITPLFEVGQEHARWAMELGERTEQDDDDFKGQVILAIDASLPFATTRQILYTMGQAQFFQYAFVVDDDSPSPFGSLKASPPSGSEPSASLPPLHLNLEITKKGITILGADTVLHPTGLPLVAPGQARPATTPCPDGGCETVADYDWTELKRLLVKIKQKYPAKLNYIVVPSQDTSHAVLTRLFDISRSYTVDGQTQPLFPWVIIAGGKISDAGGTDSGGPSISTQRPAPAATVSPARRLAIFTSCLPAIRPPRMEDAPAPKAFEGAVDGQCDDLEAFIEEPPEEPPDLPGSLFLE